MSSQNTNYGLTNNQEKGLIFQGFIPEQHSKVDQNYVNGNDLSKVAGYKPLNTHGLPYKPYPVGPLPGSDPMNTKPPDNQETGYSIMNAETGSASNYGTPSFKEIFGL